MECSIGYACRPCHHIPPSGDGWLALRIGSTYRLMLADGIGHGSSAHRIVEALREHLIWICRRSSRLIGLDDCLVSLHHCLQQQNNTSQAAVALLDLDPDLKTFHSLIAGNVMVRYACAERCTSCLNMPGMVGGRLPTTLRMTTVNMQVGGILSLCSDGMETAGMDDYLLSRCRTGMRRELCLQSEAEAMLQRFGKITDDASCALVSIQEGMP